MNILYLYTLQFPWHLQYLQHLQYDSQSLFPEAVFKIATNLHISMVQWKQYPANKTQPHTLPVQTAGSQLV